MPSRGLPARTLLLPREGRRHGIVIEEDHRPAGFQIVELPMTNGPEERSDGEAKKTERQWDEHEDDVHEADASPIRAHRPHAEGISDAAGRGRRLRRTALSTTTRELSDMPIAASQGVTQPAAASGSTTRL